MAYSFNRYTGDGETVDYTLSFPYLNKNHVLVTVGGVEVTNWTWLTTASIRFDEAPLLNEIIVIARCTPKDDRLVDFKAGSILDPSTLNMDSKQLLYVMQEVLDGVTNFNENGSPVVYDRDSILSALTGYIDSSRLTASLQESLDFSTLMKQWNTIYESGIYGDENLYKPIFESELDRVDAAITAVGDTVTLHTESINTMDGNIDAALADIELHDGYISANVADIESIDGRVETNEGQLSLMGDEFFVKLDSNGNVAGFGLLNDEVSQFTVNADKFAIIKADGTGDIKKPFVVDTASGTIAIDGSMVVSGSISAAKLAANSVTADKISAGVITASKLQGTNFGTLTLSSSSKIIVSATNGIEINDGADIKLIGDATNPGVIYWYGTSYATKAGSNASGSRFDIGPLSSGLVDLCIGGYSGTGRWERWKTLYSYSTLGFDFRAISDNVTLTYSGHEAEITAQNTNSYSFGGFTTNRVVSQGGGGFLQFDSRVILYSYDSGTSAFSIFGPVSYHKKVDCGHTSHAWDDVVGDDFVNVADFYWMDERVDEVGNVIPVDDIATIKAIKPSKKVDPITGLRSINDSTIPPWLAHKHKKDGGNRNAEGELVATWKKGDTSYGPEGKPYLSLKTMISLLMGAVRQLDDRIERIESNGSRKPS